MAKKFLIIIPMNKPAYAKEYGGNDKAFQVITEKCGMIPKESEALINGEEYTVLSGCSKKKVESKYNRRASEMCGEDIFGHAVLCSEFSQNTIDGFSQSAAERLVNEINEL